MKKIEAIRYRTINECLSKFFGCSVKDLEDLEGHWEWMDADGVHNKSEVQESLNMIRKRNCWGWVENKKIIHFFIRKKASLKDRLSLFSHEIGHITRPYHRTAREEQKANIFSMVAITAYNMAIETMNTKGGSTQ